MKKLTLMAILPLLMTACASGPTITANANPAADFRSFQTYGFMQPLGTDRSGGARTPLSARLMDSMSRELEARGLARSDPPDLLVDFVITTQDRIDVRTTPTTSSVHRSHWNRGWSTWPTYSTTVRQYTEGTLLIDLIDPARGMLVAEGSATSRIRSSEFDQQQIDDVVSRIMAGIWAN